MRIYIGENAKRSEFTKENIPFLEIFKDLQVKNTFEKLTILCNINIPVYTYDERNGYVRSYNKEGKPTYRELDFLVLTENAILVYDLKDCSEPLVTYSIRGEWNFIDENNQKKRVPGGSYTNPYQQSIKVGPILRRFIGKEIGSRVKNDDDFKDLFNKDKDDAYVLEGLLQKKSHGFVVFTPNANPKNKDPEKLKVKEKYRFSILNQDQVSSSIFTYAGKGNLRLLPNEINAIIEKLECREWIEMYEQLPKPSNYWVYIENIETGQLEKRPVIDFLSFGRENHNNYMVDEKYSMVSKSHCIIYNRGGHLFISDGNKDLGNVSSTFGTFFNSKKLKEGDEFLFDENDVVKFGADNFSQCMFKLRVVDKEKDGQIAGKTQIKPTVDDRPINEDKTGKADKQNEDKIEKPEVVKNKPDNPEVKQNEERKEKQADTSEDDFGTEILHKEEEKINYKLLVWGKFTFTEQFELQLGNNVFGSATQNEGIDIETEDLFMGEKHFSIKLNNSSESKLYLKDLGSIRGTIVNDQPISHEIEINPNTVFKFGETYAKIEIDS